MDLSLVPEILIIILTFIVIVALVSLYRSARHKYSTICIMMIIVEYIFELLRVLYFVKLYWNRTNVFLFYFPLRGMPIVSLTCSVLLGTIILSSVPLKKLLVKVVCFVYVYLSLITIIIWNYFLATCLIVEHPAKNKHTNCDSYLKDWNLMDYYQCLNDGTISMLHIMNKPRPITSFYCFENQEPVTSGYFLEYLLFFVPSFVVLYQTVYKT